jgi:hypothetical protein
MSVSASVLSVLGIAFLFISQAGGPMVDLDRVSPLGVQLLAAGLLGFAALNWVGRSGIYGRPIVLANFGYGIISVMTLASAVLDERLTSRVCRLVAVFAMQTGAFSYVMRVAPWRHATVGVGANAGEAT